MVNCLIIQSADSAIFYSLENIKQIPQNVSYLTGKPVGDVYLRTCCYHLEIAFNFQKILLF